MTKARSNASSPNALGDLVVGTGTGTASVLPVSTSSGDTIVADSSTSTGLRYQAPKTANPLINSAFDVWQRGTSFSTGNAYTADRWYVGNPTQTFTVSRQATGDTTNLPNIQYCVRFARNSGQTATSAMELSNAMETIDSIPFAGKTVTVTYYARKGANYSAASNAFGLTLYSGTGTDQKVGSFTGINGVAGATATLTTTWQRFTASGTVPTNATQLGIYANWTPVGTAGVADYVEITGVQVEVGSVATPFNRYSATIQGELAACQRYYYRQNATASSSYAVFGTGFANATSTLNIPVVYPVTMRTKPSALDTAAMALYAWEGAGSGNTPTSITLDSNYSSCDGGVCVVTKSASFVATSFYRFEGNGSSGSYLGWSAEL